jgi:peptidyl-tRNA hydrolase
MSDVLWPLAARYAEWLDLPAEETADTSDEDPSQIRAMQVILRIERSPQPARTALLEAAATAAVAVCLDPRAQSDGQSDGEWHGSVKAWMDGRIRKIARRARGAHWVAAQDFPGITVNVRGAEVRALVPGLVLETPKEISRLQISGSDLPPDEPGPVSGEVPLLLLNPEVSMTVGKAAAQVGHGTMILASLIDNAKLTAWQQQDFRCAVRTPSLAEWKRLHPGHDPEKAWREHAVIAVRDAGFTEVDPGTVTVLAQWRSSDRS